MTISRSTYLRTSWIGSIVALVVIWCLWSLEHTPRSLTAYVDNGISESQKQAQQAATVEAALEAIEIDKLTRIGDVEKAEIEATKQDGEPSKVSERPLILYAYSEAEEARVNLKFFLAHGIHAAADFIFILNGETDVASLIPNNQNIRYIQRPNDCYDLGAYAEVLQEHNLYKDYKKFIMLNASLRGPFIPYWSESCWTDIYLTRITEEVKLVGMTSNCLPTFHVQSMIWATDRIGIETLLFPPEAALQHLKDNPIVFPHLKDSSVGPILQPPGINVCFHNWDSAVHAEVSSTSLIKAAGYQVDALMSAYHGVPGYSDGACNIPDKNGDVLHNGKYWETNIHPFETIFFKSNRGVDPISLQRHTEWIEGRKYSSYDYCHA